MKSNLTLPLAISIGLVGAAIVAITFSNLKLPDSINSLYVGAPSDMTAASGNVSGQAPVSSESAPDSSDAAVPIVEKITNDARKFGRADFISSDWTSPVGYSSYARTTENVNFDELSAQFGDANNPTFNGGSGAGNTSKNSSRGKSNSGSSAGASLPNRRANNSTPTNYLANYEWLGENALSGSLGAQVDSIFDAQNAEDVLIVSNSNDNAYPAPLSMGINYTDTSANSSQLSISYTPRDSVATSVPSSTEESSSIPNTIQASKGEPSVTRNRQYEASPKTFQSETFQPSATPNMQLLDDDVVVSTQPSVLLESVNIPPTELVDVSLPNRNLLPTAPSKASPTPPAASSNTFTEADAVELASNPGQGLLDTNAPAQSGDIAKVIPEPATIMMLSFGLFGVAARRLKYTLS